MMYPMARRGKPAINEIQNICTSASPYHQLADRVDKGITKRELTTLPSTGFLCSHFMRPIAMRGIYPICRTKRYGRSCIRSAPTVSPGMFEEHVEEKKEE